MQRVMYRLSDGLIVPPITPVAGAVGAIEVSDRQQVDWNLDRVDLATQQIRRATQTELDARENEVESARAVVESRRVDVLTTIAWVVRRDMGPATFDALTPAQKKAAILNQADVWQTLRAAIARTVR